MSFTVSKVSAFPQSILQYAQQSNFGQDSQPDAPPLLGGLLSDAKHVWHARGPCLEVRNTKTCSKVGAWTFGCILKDSNTRIVCVEEILRPNGRLSLLAVGIECTISGGLVCIFDAFGSKVIRAIQIKEKISSLHVIDSGLEILNLPGPLRNFDGILAVGTVGGNVFLIDICRQICEESINAPVLRDELLPCQIVSLTARNISKIEHYKERSVKDGNHLAIHLNAVLNSRTDHFILKGPKGDDRIHVNKDEVVTSALYYCGPLTSLLVGYNFGAFQLWNLTTLKLIYTSPVCNEHLPVTNFALQEPTDDPRAFCYIWVTYSNTEMFQSGLPFAVMYSVCYESKEYNEGYGYLYQDFQYCAVRIQMELGQVEDHRSGMTAKGGYCLKLQPVSKLPTNKELYSHYAACDTLALCVISWTVWFNQNERQTAALIFDLNQWYKEQMPSFTKWKDCNNYILRVSLSDLIINTGHAESPLLNILMDGRSLTHFVGVQRLEEHFYPTSLSFDLWSLRENDVVLIHCEGLQKSLLFQLESAGSLCLIRPADVYRQSVILGLMPLFIDISSNMPISSDNQREIILNIGLEHQLVGWLCKCASEWANGSFSSAGCSLDFLINWAFQRALTLKTNCDKYCASLFDYSHTRLDSNTSILLNNCIRQINNLCMLYKYIVNNLAAFVSSLELVSEQHTMLEMVSTYFEVLQWLVNVGLLPECHPSRYPRPDNSDRISAPYPVHELTEYYNEKRAQLRLLSKETFASSDSLLFIDNLISNKCGAERLHKQWQEDGGSGLYPPPSLQSMLRTYLVSGASICHKHSLVIYIFLDLAMALDQSRYASVITHLIKFPAVFKVSSSIIKITQAFWQLDHGDYTTAMEQLLDPFVLGEDLQPWHHAIALRALLLQNQYNFALLYMQIRKPPMTDEKDILTAISLFIANNMLDEAFYFKKQHQNNNEEKLLMHLFHECNKNESLHLLLYKCLNTVEEKAFFKYLKSVKSPNSDDLQVFYYLLRSRFIEAFDAHSNMRRRKPDSQGLIGQRNATKTDQIVNIFKSLLPDVNRNLVTYVRKERTNLWNEVPRPTPLSVFVHNSNEQIQYKSTVIHAALAKAKHTFNDTFNDRQLKELITEQTPFLRTPKAHKNSFRRATPIITPKLIELNECGVETGPSPSKRLKLSPRISTTSPTYNQRSSMHSKMLTPIVKRKIFSQQDESLFSNCTANVCTPQSILKVTNLVRQNDSLVEDTILDEDYDKIGRKEISSSNSCLSLHPRRSLSNRPRHSHVQFNDAARFSSSLSDQSSRLIEANPSENQLLQKSTLSSNDISLMVSSKNSSASTAEEVFYSPSTSFDELSHEKIENNIEADTKKRESDDMSSKQEVEKEEIEIVPAMKTSNESGMQTPRARRSYKRSFREMSPVRSSPRLAKSTSAAIQKNIDLLKNTEQSNEAQSLEDLASATINDSVPVTTRLPDEHSEDLQKATSDDSPTTSSTNNESTSIDSSPSLQSPRILQKVKGRKSLSRRVLEQNTFSKMFPPASAEKFRSKELTYSRTEKNVLSITSLNSSSVTSVETSMVISDTSTSELESPVSNKSHIVTRSVEKKKVVETPMDSDTSVDSEVSFEFAPAVCVPELKLSDSLAEYISYIKSRNKADNFDLGESRNEISEHSDDDIVKNDETAEDKMLDVSLEKEANEVVSMEIYEDLSSDAEDREEALKPSRKETDESEAVQPNAFDELEVNIFELSDDPVLGGNRDMGLGRAADLNSTSLAEEAENGFLASAITISSDEDDADSNRSEDSEKSVSTIDNDLNISHEPNINAEDTSSSSNYSENDVFVCSSKQIESKEPPAEIMDAVHSLEEQDKKLHITEDRRPEDILKNSIEEQEAQIDDIEQTQQENFVCKAKIDDDCQQNSIIEAQETNQDGAVPVLVTTNFVQIETYSETQAKTVAAETEEEPQKMETDTNVNTTDIVEQSHGAKPDPKDKTAAFEVHVNKEKLVEDNQEIDVMEEVVSDNKSSEKKDITDTGTYESTELGNIAQGIFKTDQSTNTTTILTTEDSTFVSKEEISTGKEIHDEKLIEDRTNSSEGERLKQGLVVKARIHTPSKKSTETLMVKRVTRRNSTLIVPTPDGDVLNTATDMEPVENIADSGDSPNLETSILFKSSIDVSAFPDFGSPAMRTRRSMSAATNESGTSNSRKYTNKGDIDCKPSSSKEIIEDSKVTKLTLRKTRSASIDEIKTYSKKDSFKTDIINENSTNVTEVRDSKPSGRAKSVSYLSTEPKRIIDKGDRVGRRNKSGSAIETYASSRRLTRRQASMVKDVSVPLDEAEEGESDADKSMEVDHFDPINLLDKESFKGEPDLDEQKVYERSSPSNSTVSVNKPARRNSRSASAASDTSIYISVGQSSTPKKKLKESGSHVDSHTSLGVKTRSRKQTGLSSAISDKSEPVTPPKRSRKKIDDNEADSATPKPRSTRSRSRSVSSIVTEPLSSARKSSRSKRIVSARTELPEIAEEKGSEVDIIQKSGLTRPSTLKKTKR